MKDEELARAIARGIVETHIEAGYDEVSRTTNEEGDYPSMGVSQWEGLGGRGDDLLAAIPGGDRFAGRAFSDIEAKEELDALCAVLGSPAGREAQDRILAADCLEMYVPVLKEVLTNPACIIYAGMWCPTGHGCVRNFIARRIERGYDVNDLEVLRDTFYNEYAGAAEVPTNCYEGYRNRAIESFNFVVSLGVA